MIYYKDVVEPQSSQRTQRKALELGLHHRVTECTELYVSEYRRLGGRTSEH